MCVCRKERDESLSLPPTAAATQRQPETSICQSLRSIEGAHCHFSTRRVFRTALFFLQAAGEDGSAEAFSQGRRNKLCVITRIPHSDEGTVWRTVGGETQSRLSQWEATAQLTRCHSNIAIDSVTKDNREHTANTAAS